MTQNRQHARTIPSIIFMIGALACLFFASNFRYIETWMASYSFQWFGLGTARYLGGDKMLASGLGVPVRFTVTQQCGVMLLISPMLVAAALLVRSAQVKIYKVFVGVTLSALALIVANQGRLALIGWSIKILGFKQGFPLGHLVLGTILSIVSVVASLLLFVRIAKTKIPERRFS